MQKMENKSFFKINFQILLKRIQKIFSVRIVKHSMNLILRID
jgi:hypothetical protein